MNFIDIAILALILLGALFGLRKGLITSGLNFLGVIAGFVLASWHYMTALRWAEQYVPLHGWIEPVFYSALLPVVQSKANSLQEEGWGGFLSILPSEWRGSLEEQSTAQIAQAVEQISHNLAGMLTERLLSLLAFVCVFGLVVLIVRIIGHFILQPFGGRQGLLNRGGGLIFGGLSALVGMSVLAGLLFPLVQAGLGGNLDTFVQNSIFYAYLLEVFHFLDQNFAAQISDHILEPLLQGQGIWFK